MICRILVNTSMGAAEVTSRAPVFWALPVACVTSDRGMVTRRTGASLSSTITSHLKNTGTSVNAHVDQHLCMNLTLEQCGMRQFISKSDFPICYKDADLSDRLCLVFPIRREYEWEIYRLKFGYCEI